MTALALAGCGSPNAPASGSTTPAGTTTTTQAQASTPAAGPTTSSPASTPSQSTPKAPTAGPTTPARTRFIGQADQICRAANTALLAPQTRVNAAFKAEQANGSAAHRTALAAAVRAESAVASAELTRLRAVAPPPGDRPFVGRYLAAVASQVGLVNHLAADVAANDGTGLTAVGKRLAAGKSTVDGLAAAYGFKVCGNVAG